MKILAPVNTIESAINAISSGADEIYLGADDCFFHSYSFTGRGKYSFNGLKVLSSFDDVSKIVEYAHSKNVLVNFLCNTQFLADNESKMIENEILKYIEKAASINIDSIVIGDIGLLYLLNKNKIEIPIHASLYFRSINVEQLKFLKELGVVRTTLSYLVTIDDIKEMVESNVMEIEVPGYLGCSFFNGACNCLHALGEGVFDNFDQGIICKSLFQLSSGDTRINGNIFDNELGCSICSLKTLDKIGVTALKIVGRDRDYKQTSEAISIYKQVLRNNYSLEQLPKSWKRTWCRNNRCKFINNNNIKYYI